MAEDSFSHTAKTIGIAIWSLLIGMLCIFGTLLLFDSDLWRFGLGVLTAAFLFSVPLIALKVLLRPFSNS